jgi:hypothetical protein
LIRCARTETRLTSDQDDYSVRDRTFVHVLTSPATNNGSLVDRTWATETRQQFQHGCGGGCIAGRQRFLAHSASSIGSIDSRQRRDAEYSSPPRLLQPRRSSG